MAELDRVLIASRIKHAREKAGLTQSELGDALAPPVHWRTVQTWESAKDRRVPWGRLDQIATVTDTTKEWLLHGREPADTSEHRAPTETEQTILEQLAELRGLVAQLVRDRDQRSDHQQDGEVRERPAQ
jgi:hypothetical protein